MNDGKPNDGGKVMALIDEDAGREHITDDSEECWCNPRVITVDAHQAVPIAAKNAAFLTMANELGHDATIYEERFGQALNKALEAAAPHMQCGCEHKPEPYGREVALLDISKLEIGERVELNGRTGTVTMVDTVLPDMSTGLPVVLVNWDDQP